MRVKIASQVPVTQAVVSGSLTLNTTAGAATFSHGTINFQSYAGADIGYTPYLFTFTDDAGETATAYGSGKDGATGVKLVSAKNGTTRDMTSIDALFNASTVVSVSIQRQRVAFLNVRP